MTQPVVLVNPHSGTGAEIADLERVFPTCRVEECPPDELAARVRSLRDAGVPFVAVAGGDGTLRTAAESLVGGDVPLLAVPAGTRNHFAKDFGIMSVEEAGAAAVHGVRRAIDIGFVNDRYFINNSSVGAYPHLVEAREERESRWPKQIAAVLAAWREIRHGHRLPVVIDGRRFVVWMVFVGNGRYGENLRDVTSRGALDQNVLDVRIVHADQRFARFRLVVSALFGRSTATPVVTRRDCQRVTIEVPKRRQVKVALDGEVVTLTTPLVYESRAGALPVLTPMSSE